MTPEKCKEKTLEIIEIILEEVNGYTKEEIKNNNLAEDCEGSALFTKIQESLQSK